MQLPCEMTTVQLLYHFLYGHCIDRFVFHHLIVIVPEHADSDHLILLHQISHELFLRLLRLANILEHHLQQHCLLDVRPRNLVESSDHLVNEGIFCIFAKEFIEHFALCFLLLVEFF